MSQFLTSDQLPAAFVASVREKSRADAEREARQAAQAQEWRKRGGLFTASELWKLFTSGAKPANNVTSQGYIMEKLVERITGYPIERGNGFRETEWGKEHEATAVAEFERVTGLVVSNKGDEQRFLKVPGLPFGATLDGTVGDHGILECKCPFNPANHYANVRNASNLAWFKKNRFEYFLQVQGGMFASERPMAYFVSFDPGTTREKDATQRVPFLNADYPRHCIAEIPRDESYITLIREAVEGAEAQLQAMMN
jgi:hypothetical protein